MDQYPGLKASPTRTCASLGCEGLSSGLRMLTSARAHSWPLPEPHTGAHLWCLRPVCRGQAAPRAVRPPCAGPQGTAAPAPSGPPNLPPLGRTAPATGPCGRPRHQPTPHGEPLRGPRSGRRRCCPFLSISPRAPGESASRGHWLRPSHRSFTCPCQVQLSLGTRGPCAGGASTPSQEARDRCWDKDSGPAHPAPCLRGVVSEVFSVPSSEKSRLPVRLACCPAIPLAVSCRPAHRGSSVLGGRVQLRGRDSQQSHARAPLSHSPNQPRAQASWVQQAALSVHAGHPGVQQAVYSRLQPPLSGDPGQHRKLSLE